MGFDADVVVVGAGPGGCATALQLARRGHQVCVLDRATFPRDKVCGEGLMPHGVAALRRLGLQARVEATQPMPFTGIAYHAGGHVAVGRFPDGEAGWGMRRLVLDSAFVEACEAHPRIELRSGVKVRKLTAIPGRVAVQTREGPVVARAAVGADGLNSTVRRLAGLERPIPTPRRYGVRAHFRLGAGRADADVVTVHLADGGEFYVTPTAPGQVNVALLCGQDRTAALKGDVHGGFLAACRAHPPIAEVLRGAELLSEPKLTGPLRRDVKGVVGDSLVLVGDAAGFVDAITGEGVSLTLLSAELAAEALHAGLHTGRLSARDLSPYARRRAATTRDLRWLTQVVLWGIRHRRLATRVVRNLARRPELFGQILAVGSGHEPLHRVGLRGALGLVA